MQVVRLAEGLWRWSARHPGWTPGQGGPAGRDEEVWCVYAETPDAVVLVDPLVPEDERGRFLHALDRDVERLGLPVAVLVTVDDHERSAGELARRYDAELWAPAVSALRMRAPVTRPFAPRDCLTGGVEAWDAGRPGEVALWLPSHRSLVLGDAILGDGDGGLRVCPDSWLPDGADREAFRETLTRLLRLPVERVLPAHGEPVTRDAAAALRAAIEA